MIRVAVGCAPNHDDIESQAVFEWSLRKHSSEPVEITWMMLSRDPSSLFYSIGNDGWHTQNWATPFTGFRWAVPALCGFEGKAIYSDSDVIWMADVAELYYQEFQPHRILMGKGGGSWRFCVSMWDCAAAKSYLWPIERLQAESTSHMKMTQMVLGQKLVQGFVGDWNCLDGEGHPNLNDGKLKALHYTSMPHQPQLKYALPRLARLHRKHWFDGKVQQHWRPDLGVLFAKLLHEAIDNGYPPEKYMDTPVYGEIRKQKLTTHRGRIAS